MPVYLDNNATTRLDPRVLEAMQPYLLDIYGNGSSLHRYGRLIRSAIEQAREQLAAAVNAHPDQIVFTSGGTEANNLVLKGIAAGTAPQSMLISSIEHASVREPAFALRKQGWQVDEIPVLASGRLDTEALPGLIDDRTRLVSVMLANNETGVIQPVQQVAGIVRETGAVLHSDASQALGKYPVDFAGSGAQLMTLSAHKLHGPLGAGALLADRGVVLQPQQRGGRHELGLRAGTENVAAIVGFGTAAQLAVLELDQRRACGGYGICSNVSCTESRKCAFLESRLNACPIPRSLVYVVAMAKRCCCSLIVPGLPFPAVPPVIRMYVNRAMCWWQCMWSRNWR